MRPSGTFNEPAVMSALYRMSARALGTGEPIDLLGPDFGRGSLRICQRTGEDCGKQGTVLHEIKR
jgi:hypothetical protein